MAIARLVPRNQMQAAGIEVLKAARVTNGVTGLYTVPSGKRAVMNGMTGLQDALGTDATAAIGIFRAALFIPLSTFITNVVPNNFVQWDGRILLQAADVVTNRGDNGATNHTWDLTASIREYQL